MVEMSSLVSVIIPTRNRAGLVGRAIGSVLGQTYRNLEAIVIDDDSADETEQVVGGIDDSRIIYIRRRSSGGASGARNTGIAQARGDYIAFLDDDDEWLPQKLAKQVALLDAAPPDVGMVYCWMDHFNSAGRLVGETHPTLRGHVFDKVLDRQRLGGCPTLLVRESVVRETGGFDEDLPRGNDGDFIRRVCLRYAVDVVPEVLVRVHVDHGPRISDLGREGFQEEVIACRVRLEKFGEQLRQRPAAHAAILRRLAIAQARLGERTAAWEAMLRAIRLHPGSARTYVDTLRLVKAYFV
jgi:glycosyltransferase involved in cell wall biosynthesis